MPGTFRLALSGQLGSHAAKGRQALVCPLELRKRLSWARGGQLDTRDGTSGAGSGHIQRP